MSTDFSRRNFVVCVAATGATLVVSSSAAAATAGPPQSMPDADVQTLIALSHGHGVPNIQQASFLRANATTGTLAVARSERAALLTALANRDFAAMRRNGLHIVGQRFVFIRDDNDGTTLHAACKGSFVTVENAGDQVIIALSSPGMDRGRAAFAVHRFATAPMA